MAMNGGVSLKLDIFHNRFLQGIFLKYFDEPKRLYLL